MIPPFSVFSATPGPLILDKTVHQEVSFSCFYRQLMLSLVIMFLPILIICCSLVANACLASLKTSLTLPIIYLSIYLSMYLSIIYLSISIYHPSIYLSNLCIYSLSIYHLLSVYPSIYYGSTYFPRLCPMKGSIKILENTLTQVYIFFQMST